MRVTFGYIRLKPMTQVCNSDRGRAFVPSSVPHVIDLAGEGATLRSSRFAKSLLGDIHRRALCGDENFAHNKNGRTFRQATRTCTVADLFYGGHLTPVTQGWILTGSKAYCRG